MNKKIANRFLLLIIAVSLVASLFQIGVRISAEKKENTLDIAADYYTFKTFANSYGKTVYDAIGELKNNGLVSVGLPEQNIQDIVNSGKASQWSGSDILTGNIPESIKNSINFTGCDIKPFYTIIFTKDGALAKRMKANLPSSTDIVNGKNGTYAVIIHSDPTDAQNFGIGFDDSEIEKFKTIGVNVILRPRYAPGNNNLKTLEDTIKKYDIHSVMFYGQVINGAGNEQTKALADFFKKNKVVTYIIELPIQKGVYKQEGLPQLIKETNYYVARVYSIYPAEQLKLTASQIFNRWFRSVSDRNIRVIYAKPIIDTGKSYEDNMKINDYYIGKLHKLWSRKGLNIGIPHPMPEVDISVYMILLIMSGIVALLVLYADILFDMKSKDTFLWFISLILLFGGLVLFKKNLSEKILALLGAITITGMVSLIVFRYVKKIYGKKDKFFTSLIKDSVTFPIITFVFSLIGALWIAALLSPSPYLLNLDMFRGVKVLYLSPFLFLIVNYLYVFGANFNNKNMPKEKYNIIEETEKAWNIRVKWGHIIILIALAGIFLIYILRSGNTGVSISSVELKFRAFLEQHIIARPRFKEFLIGYPSLLLTVMAARLMRKKWLIVFAALAVMGSMSVVDTFSHLRETFLVSMYRSLWGIAIGIIVSIILLLLSYVLLKKIINNEK